MMKKLTCLLLCALFLVGALPALALPEADLPSHQLPFEQLVGDNGDKTAPNDPPPKDTYRIVVDITNQVVTIYDKQTDEIVRQCLCSTGKRSKPSPTGNYTMGKHKVRFGYFVNHGVYGQYWTQITRNIYFHSIIYTKRSANTWTKSSYKNLGTRASSGCIRLPVPDARWIYYNIAPGTEITLSTKMKKDEALRESLTLAPLPSTRPKNLTKVPRYTGEPLDHRPTPTPTPAPTPRPYE